LGAHVLLDLAHVGSVARDSTMTISRCVPSAASSTPMGDAAAITAGCSAAMFSTSCG